jgi:hypothetical protein
MQMTVMDCPDLFGDYFINISAVSFVIVSFLQLSLEETIKYSLTQTNQNASQPQPPAVMFGRDGRAKLKDLAGNGGRHM